MDDAILLDLADQVARNAGWVDAKFAQSMTRRIHRKFGQTVLIENLLVHAHHFRDIYLAAVNKFPSLARPYADGIARLEDIDDRILAAMLQSEFPHDSPEVIKAIQGWAIYNDYLH
jgi:hypothetical protein